VPGSAGAAAERGGLLAVRFRAACEGGNPLMSPADLAEMLSSLAGDGADYSVAHVHRSEIALRPATAPRPDMAKLRSLLRQEGHLAAAKIFSNSGPWAGPLETRISVS
jgi:hypothetical protein